MTGKLLTAIALLVVSATACYGDIYTWKDGRGVAHYTNSIHEIPARYLKKARVLDVATGKLGGLATAQPPQKGAVAQLPQPGQAAQPPAAGTAAAAATPTGAPVPSVSTAPSPPSPGAMAPPAAVPAPRSINLPPPSPEAQRKLSRIRARSQGRSSEEQ